MPIEIRQITDAEYQAVLDIWHETGDMTGAMIDSPAGLENYLKQNDGLSLVAIQDGVVVGAALCGHDNGRGRVFQLAVSESENNSQISRILLDKALYKLGSRGDRSCRLCVPGSKDTSRVWDEIRWGDLPPVTPTCPE